VETFQKSGDNKILKLKLKNTISQPGLENRLRPALNKNSIIVMNGKKSNFNSLSMQ